MRTFVLVLASLSLPSGGTHLASDYSRARILRTTSELEIDLETTLMEVTIDDEPGEDPGRGGGGSSLVRRAVLIDHCLEGDAEGPRHVKRTFEVLHDDSSFSFGGDERSDARDFPLRGVTLEFVRDDEGEVRSELADGPEPDDADLLEGHPMTLTLDALLPESAVELDGSWSLGSDGLRGAMASALDPKLFAEAPPEERGGGREGERGGERRGPGRGRGGPARNLGSLEWEGKAKLVALEDDAEGSPCARVSLEIEGKGDLPEPGFRGPPRGFSFDPSSSREGTVRAELRGELLISLASRHPVSLELDGELTVESRFERERDGHTFSSHSVQSGRMTLKIQIEEQ